MKKIAPQWAVLAVVLAAAFGSLPALRPGTSQSSAPRPPSRPHYQITTQVDYELLTFRSSARITIPAGTAASLSDAVFFLYANAKGIVGDERRKNMVVDTVSLDKSPLPFTLDGPVLRVRLAEARTPPFSLVIDYHGIVPRGAPDSGGGLAALMGPGLGDITGLLGGSAGQRPSAGGGNYGLYSYGDGMLSLGSFWYPQLAVRQQGRWRDEEPAGFGDIAFAETGDFDVSLTVPASVVVAATGQPASSEIPVSGTSRTYRLAARNARDFAVLMSEDYVRQSQSVDVEGRQVSVEAFAIRRDQARLEQAIDIAGKALQIYARRFGPYPYGSLKVVQAPIRGGAGGMEYSGLVAIASMLYQDWQKEISNLAGALPIGGLDKLFSALGAQSGGSQGTKGGGAQATDPLSTLFQGLMGQQGDMLGSILEMTLAHEVAHQWWAMSVGSDSQQSPFVDESLTNYSAILYFEDRYGKARADQMAELHLKTPYSFGRMFGLQDAPANLPTSAYAGDLQYAAVVYGKGALYYGAVRREMGDDAFFASLREYFTKYEGRLAGPGALLEIMRAKAPHANVDALYKRWIEGKYGDEDIGGGSDLMGIGELLKALLSGSATAPSPPP